MLDARSDPCNQQTHAQSDEAERQRHDEKYRGGGGRGQQKGEA